MGIKVAASVTYSWLSKNDSQYQLDFCFSKLYLLAQHLYVLISLFKYSIRISKYSFVISYPLLQLYLPFSIVQSFLFLFVFRKAIRFQQQILVFPSLVDLFNLSKCPLLFIVLNGIFLDSFRCETELLIELQIWLFDFALILLGKSRCYLDSFLSVSHEHSLKFRFKSEVCFSSYSLEMMFMNQMWIDLCSLIITFLEVVR